MADIGGPRARPRPLWYTPEAIRALLDAHVARYPLLGLRDAYKLLYQAVLGPEHLITSAGESERRLRAEVAALRLGPDGPLWEPLRPDDALGRIHLRPFVEQGGSVALLSEACLRTAQCPWGTRKDLEVVWRRFAGLAGQGLWPGFALHQLDAFTGELERRGYPAMHHSARYAQTYAPAYRVVSAVQAARLINLEC